MTATTAEALAELSELARQRRALIKVGTATTNRIGGYLRGALGWRADLPEKEREIVVKRAQRIIAHVTKDKALPKDDKAVADAWRGTILATYASLAPLAKARSVVEHRMERLARGLPSYAFVKAVAGFGDLGFAVIMARCCGRTLAGLADFPSPEHMWKRLGMEPPTDDQQERMIGAKARSEIFSSLYDSMLRAQWAAEKDGIPAHPIGPYGEVYGAAKARYMQRVADTADLPMRIDGKRNKDKWIAARADRAARRYMAKRVLRNLWRAWREASHSLSPTGSVPRVVNS